MAFPIIIFLKIFQTDNIINACVFTGQLNTRLAIFPSVFIF